MATFKCQTNSKAQISNQQGRVERLFWILDFDIDLAFACLREAASAKAGVLTFGFEL